jgi:hypothetical protein
VWTRLIGNGVNLSCVGLDWVALDLMPAE